MLISSQGFGSIGVPLIFGAVFLGLGAERLHPGAMTLGMGVGFIVAGAIMRVVGRRMNREGPHHCFCEMRMERWVYVFVPIGLVLTWIGLTASGAIPHL